METATKKYQLTHRPRRNRKSEAIRELVQETRLHPAHFVAPLFVREGTAIQEPIESMPGVYRYSLDLLIHEARELYASGIRAVDLFALVPKEKKDTNGSEAVNRDNLVCRSVLALKEAIPDLCIMVDVALDPYTSHGHDGIVDPTGYVMNDATSERLAEMSIISAEAGADVIAPSDMMDGRVAVIRDALDNSGYENVSILSYTAKYASAFYGPFRDALESAPQFGDKKSYQMNPANSREALLEAALDEAEGADMLLVKPALAYLDVIQNLKSSTSIPIGAYHVSGEYAMIMAAAERGWIDGDKALLESLISIKRAGADFIFTYAAKKIARFLNP